MRSTVGALQEGRAHESNCPGAIFQAPIRQDGGVGDEGPEGVANEKVRDEGVAGDDAESSRYLAILDFEGGANDMPGEVRTSPSSKFFILTFRSVQLHAVQKTAALCKLQ